MIILNVIDLVASKSRRRVIRVKAVDFIVVHHSVTPPDYGWEDILRIHLAHKPPYQSIGYHFVIRGTSGQVYKCLPISPAVIGAHAYMQNAVSIGICVTGNYEENEPREVALTALKELLAELHSAYPKAKILGHREMLHSKTACPGKHLQAALVAMRS